MRMKISALFPARLVGINEAISTFLTSPGLPVAGFARDAINVDQLTREKTFRVG